MSAKSLVVVAPKRKKPKMRPMTRLASKASRRTMTKAPTALMLPVRLHELGDPNTNPAQESRISQAGRHTRVRGAAMPVPMREEYVGAD